jgi:hypothetical protein
VVRLLEASSDLMLALTNDVDVRKPNYEEAMKPVREYMQIGRQLVDFSARMAGFGDVIDELNMKENADGGD